MGWNLRRRPVTSVVRVQSGKKDEKPKSPWNTLEAWKFAAGCLTPIAITFIGIHATNQVRDQDAARIAKEELKATKQALLPIVNDIDAQQEAYFEAFARVGLSALAAPPNQHKVKHPGATISAASRPWIDNLDALRKSTSEHDKKINSDWARIRLLVDDDKKVARLRDFYEGGIINGLMSDISHCEYDAGGGLVPGIPGACLMSLDTSQASDCLAFIQLRLEKFNEPIDAEVEKQAEEYCWWKPH